MAAATIPQFASLDDALASLFGDGVTVVRKNPVSGGDINRAYKVVLTNGKSLFMKLNARENASFFTAEATGIRAIAQTNTIGTPHILCTGTDESENCSFLLMEFLDSGSRIAGFWEMFAHQLAKLHQADTREFVQGGRFGFGQDNFIGATAQINTAYDSWVSFFRDCRLKPQFQRAAAYFSRTDERKIDRLLERLDDILVEPSHPSLLHGDLWSGNFITGSDGRAWLIDPAAYVGHAEADVAMTELFGGFPAAFYAAYKEEAPLQPDYEGRRDLYNLYHLLNHLNLFGQTYLPSVKRILHTYTD